MDLKRVTIGDITYHVEKVENHEIITGQRYVFFGISWYKVIDFNLHNHIKKIRKLSVKTDNILIINIDKK